MARKNWTADEARQIWIRFAEYYYLFRGTPTRMWLDFAFEKLFGLEERLCANNAGAYYDTISDKLASPGFRPRALYDQFNIEVLATTNSPLDPLTYHQAIRDSGWKARILPTFRPDSVVDPAFDGFRQNVQRLGEMHGEDCSRWQGYLLALRHARDRFKKLGCTATDHGHPTAKTADLAPIRGRGAFRPGDRGQGRRRRTGTLSRPDADGNGAHERRGRAGDADPSGQPPQSQSPGLSPVLAGMSGRTFPLPTDYVHGLQPLLDRFGNDASLTVILFTLDESTYSRELAPLAGHYPCLRLGPPWWFYDSPEGMMRFRELTTETAGFYNTVGFNDDTRAFLSIPARHDVARRWTALSWPGW